MDIPKEIGEVLKKIEKQSNPISIFIYGSRARKDFKKDSDYEVGVLYEKEKKWSRSELAKLHSVKGLNLYPFVYENFVKYELDTPFPKAVYLRELIAGAKTVVGKKVIEGMKPPKIMLSDLLEVITFQTAYALAAVLSSRQNDVITTSVEFTKSVLFGARALVVLVKKKFPLTYDEISNEILKLEMEEEYKELIKHAIDVRAGKSVDFGMLYTNISFLNQVVSRRIKEELQNGDRIILN